MYQLSLPYLVLYPSLELMFFHISECTIKGPESVHFPSALHIGNSSLHFGKGISKLHNGFFLCH